MRGWGRGGGTEFVGEGDDVTAGGGRILKIFKMAPRAQLVVGATYWMFRGL